jgi:hypothetical protein
MEKREDIQISLFQKIKDQLPPHVSFVDDIADLLEISNDSSYRRIRGEKPLSIHEVCRLCNHYKFSLDDLLGTTTASITFQISLLKEGTYTFNDWLKNLLSYTLATSKASRESEAMFILNELSIYNIIQVPEVFAFKLFFWQKSVINFPDFREARFRIEEPDKEMKELLADIVSHYVVVKTMELTTEECLNSYLKQIIFYREAGYFENNEDAITLCEKLVDLLNHQQKQAELGFKYPYGKYPQGEEGNLQLYHNDIILADNVVLVRAGDTVTSIITGNAINLMATHNQEFYDYNYAWGKNLLSKSVLISGSAEKERNRFYLKLREQVEKVADRLKK